MFQVSSGGSLQNMIGTQCKKMSNEAQKLVSVLKLQSFYG